MNTSAGAAFVPRSLTLVLGLVRCRSRPLVCSLVRSLSVFSLSVFSLSVSLLDSLALSLARCLSRSPSL